MEPRSRRRSSPVPLRWPSSDHPRWSVEKLRAALVRGAADAGPVGPDPFTGLGVVDADGLVGGAAKRAVEVTGPTAGTCPVCARPLRGDSVVRTSSPEGTDRWFRLEVTTPTRVTVTAGMRDAKSGVLRGDIELSLYDATLGRLDVADARSGAGKETVRAVVDNDVFVRVRNLTRHPMADGGEPRPGSLARQPRERPGGVGSATGLIESATPLPESYGARARPVHRSAAGLGRGTRQRRPPVGPAGRRRDRAPSSRGVAVSGSMLTVTPDSPLGTTRTYAVVLDGLQPPGGRTWPTPGGLPHAQLTPRTGHHGTGCRSSQSSPVCAPSASRVASHTIVSAPSSGRPRRVRATHVGAAVGRAHGVDQESAPPEARLGGEVAGQGVQRGLAHPVGRQTSGQARTGEPTHAGRDVDHPATSTLGHRRSEPADRM